MRTQGIGRDHKTGEHQLKEGPFYAFDVGDLLVGHDHGGIPEGRSQSTDHTHNGRTVRLTGAKALEIHQYHSGKSGQNADDPGRGNAFGKQQRSGCQDHGRAQIVQQRGGTDADLAIGFKEKQPAQAQGCTGNGYGQQLALQDAEAGKPPLEQEHGQKKQASDGRPVEDDGRSIQCNKADDHTVGAEDQQGRDIFSELLFHVFLVMRCFSSAGIRTYISLSNISHFLSFHKSG